MLYSLRFFPFKMQFVS